MFDSVKRGRDRDGTSASILAAAEEIIATEGFGALGVNAVARKALCDKQLIYRYFGGLEGLIDAVGDDLGLALANDLSSRLRDYQPTTYAVLMADVIVELVDVFRGNPLLRGISAWESVAPSQAVTRMGVARSRHLKTWVDALRGEMRPPETVDHGAINAILIAATQQLALNGCASGNFAGLPLQSETDWSRAKAGLRWMAIAAYGGINAPQTD